MTPPNIEVSELGQFFSQCHFLGLALSALEARKLRFPVRPKMHQLEHMKLRTGL